MIERLQSKAAIRAVLCVVALSIAPTLAGAAPQPKPPPKLCINNSNNCATSPTSDPSTGIKWHPGHYLMIRGQHKDVAYELATIDGIRNEPTVKGVLVSWKWNGVEGNKGVYDFSQIDKYLNEVKSLNTGKRLIIRIENRGFGGPAGVIVPSYMLTDNSYMGGQAAMGSGVVARIWDVSVMDRLIALHQALGARYDSDPYVEGISTSETAIGWNSKYPSPSTYSNTVLVSQLQRFIAAERAAWPHSNVFCETNYLGNDDQMEAFIKSCGGAAAAIGGPDVVPGRALQGDSVMRGDKGSGADYRGVVAIKAEVQNSSLGLTWTVAPADLYANAVTQNKANYMLWDYNNYYGGPDQKWSTGVLPFIRSIKGETVTDCPTTFHGNCMTN